MPEARALAADLAALALIALVLVLPNRPEALVTLPPLPLELPALLLVLLLARGRLRLPIRLGATVLLTMLPPVALADFGTHLAYGRPFNLVLDLHLVPASWRLASGTVGVAPALAAAVLIAGVLIGLAATLLWATGRIARHAPAGRARAGIAAAALAATALAGADAAGRIDAPGHAQAGRLLAAHGRAALATRGDLERLQAAAAEDTFADLPPDDILPALSGRDVFVVFVESYGRTALETPLYAQTIRPTLDAIETRLASRGLAARSGWLTAPMVGGQSWLAHASVLAGLPIDNQQRYQALIASPRRTLLHLAARAGWRTVAVMPAITLAWPEAGYFGYDSVLAAADLGYAGAPFNWVTMPDQFTLAAFERLALDTSPRAPVMAEIALISSHAPWTPIPPLLPWGTLGDGRVFDRYATAGDPPEVVWRDPDRVRDQYRQAIDYTLRTIGAFAGRRAGTGPLIVVLGDHQPASFVSLDPVGRDVPVHVIGPPEVVARLDGFGWTSGLLPGPQVAAWPMSAFRDRFLAAFGSTDLAAAAPDGL